MTEETAKSRYDILKVRREATLRRARDYAEITIPSLLPPEGQSEFVELPETYQSFGTRCVLSLASRLATAIIPPSGNSFRLTVPPEALIESGIDSVPPDIEHALALTETIVQAEIERCKWRTATILAAQHLIVTGNILEQTLDDNRIKLFRLDQYVVVRDPQGAVTEIVTEEYLTYASMPKTLRDMVPPGDRENPAFPLYHWIRWDADKKVWNIHQELDGQIVPGSAGAYSVSPFRVLRWCPLVGEAYGRSKVEEHYADIRSLEVLSKSILEGAAMASIHITLIRPTAAGGINLRRRLMEARNGDAIIGSPDDVSPFQYANGPGLEVAKMERDELKRDLGAAFLLTSSVARDAERVTKYEIQQGITELEMILGATYAVLADDMQQPRINRLLHQMDAKGQIDLGQPGWIKPIILTGLEALGRERDIERAGAFLEFLQALTPEERLYAKMSTITGKFAAGLQMADAVRTDAEVDQIMQQRQAQQVAADVASAAGQAAATATE